MATIAEKKSAQQKWIPTFAFNVTLKDGTPRYWSTAVFTWQGHPYQAIVSEFSPLKIEGSGVYGVDAVVELSMALNNADAGLNALLAPSNWQGGVIQPLFFFRDPDTGNPTTDSIAFPKFMVDLPTETWPKVVFSAHNKWNLARKELPLSKVTRKDRYPFPNTAAERQAAYDDPTSEFYANGYSPENGHGNWKTPPSTPYLAADYNCLRGIPGSQTEEGPGDKVSLHTIGLSVRYGGSGKVPPTTIYTPSKGQKAEFKGYANEPKYGQAVPLIFGICRVAPILLDTGHPPEWGSTGTRMSHYLLCDGVNFAPNEADMGIQSVSLVWLPESQDGKDYNVPQTSAQPDVFGAWSAMLGKYGSQKGSRQSERYRNIDDSTDYYPADLGPRDLYSGLAYLEVGLPKEKSAAESLAGPRLECIVWGLKIETWDAGGVSTWQWSDNPVWIFVHLLKLLRWKTDDIDKTAAYNAAAYCDETLANGKKRFRCNLALTQATKAADVLRGIRNNCRMYTSYGADGKLQLRIKKTVAGEGGSAFAIDNTNIVRDDSGQLQIKRFHKSAFETANVFSVTFQNEDNLRSADSFTKYDVGNINQLDERISGDSITAILGIPSFDQAERILNWLKYENVDLNEYYQVRCTLGMIEAKVGQVGTITETRLGLSSQQCRIVAITPGPGETVDITLQKHADAGYTDDATVAPAIRASSDSTYSPRSVGGLSGATGNPTLAELFIQDDLNPDLYHRKIKVDFTPPPVAYEGGFSSRTALESPTVYTTGGSIAGNQTLFVEVCPKNASGQGLASDYQTVPIPAGTSTNRFTVVAHLPAEATGYICRVSSFPGKLFKYSDVTTGDKNPTIEVTTIAGLDSSSLSPDPAYDHAHVFYYYSGSPDILRDGGRTQANDQASLTFEPEAPDPGDTSITVIVCAANADESDFYPKGLQGSEVAPKATLNLTKDSGNPSGASGLQILTNSDDSKIPPGQMVFQFSRDTANYSSVGGVAIWLHDALPAEGPYKAERDEHPSCVIETGTCTVTAGSKQITVTRSPNSAVLQRVLLIYTDDASPDSDLEGEIVTAQGTNSLTVNTPFNKSGTFTYAIVKRWWDIAGADTGNAWYQWFPIDQLGDPEQTVWRTPPVPHPTGTFYATECSRNRFGVGARATAGPKTFTSTTVPMDSVLPGVPTGLAVTGADGKFIGDWIDPATGANTLDDVCIQYATDASFTENVVTCAGWGHVNHKEGADPDKTYYFRVAEHNQSGLASNSAVHDAINAAGHHDDWDADHGWGPFCSGVGPISSGPIKLQDLQVTTGKLAAGAVTAAKAAAGIIDAVTKFVSSLKPVEIVSSLPSPGTQGRTVFLMTDNKLYRDTGSAWTTVVPAVDVGAGLTGSQIAAATITASNIQAGTITANEIAANTITGGKIAAATITSDKLSVSQLSAISANLGTITAGNITGATIQTAASGDRLVMSSSWLAGYNSGGNNVFILSSSYLYHLGYVQATTYRKGTGETIINADGVWVGTGVSCGSATILTSGHVYAGYLHADINVQIINAVSEPSAPASGGILYAWAGALKYVSQGGTRTEIAPN